MPNNELQQRDPFVGPPRNCTGASAEKVELFTEAVHPDRQACAQCIMRPKSRRSDLPPRFGSLDLRDHPAHRRPPNDGAPSTTVSSG